jgi:acyl dehydratase
MRNFKSIDELLEASNTDLGFSQWHEVTQENIDMFAIATGDQQWIHTDPERAATGPFGGPIAHGFLTLSMISMLAWEVFIVENISVTINYGLNRVRFPSPTPVGSMVRAQVQLVEVRRTDKGVQVIQDVTIECQGHPKPVCVAQTVTLLIP